MSTVLITGANRGIGLEFARQYAASGATVIATCRSPENATKLSQLTSQHSKLTVATLDLCSDESILSLKKDLSDQGTVIDLLLSNAGILINERFAKWSRDAFQDTFNTNVTGPALLVQSLDRILSKTAKVVHLSSGLGSLEWGGEGMSEGDSYAMSKAAMNMLTVRMASVYRSSQRIVVSMSPGWVATDMGGAGADLTTEESVSKMIPTIAALTQSDSGSFIDNQGNTLPW